MAYFNYFFAAEKGIKPEDIINLQLISQNRFEELAEIIETNVTIDVLRDFEQKGYTEYVKSKKKSDTPFKLVRLSSAGKELLELLTTPSISEGDTRMFAYLQSMYLEADEERKIGNRKKSLQYCAEFRQLCGLSLHEMFYLCQLFTTEYPYSKVLEYIFFQKRDNPYGKFKENLEASKLYQFYVDNKERVEAFWRNKIKETE